MDAVYCECTSTALEHEKSPEMGCAAICMGFVGSMCFASCAVDAVLQHDALSFVHWPPGPPIVLGANCNMWRFILLLAASAQKVATAAIARRGRWRHGHGSATRQPTREPAGRQENRFGVAKARLRPEKQGPGHSHRSTVSSKCKTAAVYSGRSAGTRSGKLCWE